MIFFSIQSAMASNTCSHILRVCTSLHAFQYAFELVCNQSEFDKFSLSLSIDEYLKKHLVDNVPFRTISKQTIKASYNLCSYFNKQKLALAGFVFDDWSFSYIDLISNYYQAKHKDSKTTSKDPLLALAKKVMLIKKASFSTNDVNQKISSCNATSIANVFTYLEQRKLGQVTTKTYAKNLVY